jgi:membrane fusion protein (multidrug efflux system)
MFARINIVYEYRDDALQIPRNAILDSDGRQSVFIVVNETAERRAIAPGLINNGWVEITEGLEGHEQVVVVGQGGLKTGTVVQIVDVMDADGPAGELATAR